jgi:hypothetical protein
VVEGGYRVSLFAGSDVTGLAGCRTDVALESPVVVPFLNVLALLDVVALRVKGFTGRRLGEPSGAFALAVAVVVVEEAGFRSDRERCSVDIVISVTVCRTMD